MNKRSTIVFHGPSVSVDEVQEKLQEEDLEILNPIYLPPASQGDVYKASLRHPWGIGLIDGYFEREPSVWHKEILWALSEGIHVFGSSSKGALRAAELENDGMVGVGKIFEWYRDGILEEDDEVAVILGQDAKTGFRSLSVALVNIRATLNAAEDQGVLEPDSNKTLVRLAKSLFYADRNYPALADLARSSGEIDGAEIDAWEAFRAEKEVNQKRDDAIAMLGEMARIRARHPGPRPATFVFQRTDAWIGFCRRHGTKTNEGIEPVASNTQWLDELKLQGVSPYRRATESAWNRMLGLRISAQLEGATADPELVREMTALFCHQTGLEGPDELSSWMAAQDLSPQRFQELMSQEAQLRRVQRLLHPKLPSALWDQGQLSGQSQALERRARLKGRAIKNQGKLRWGLHEAGITEEALWQWYFGECLERSVPANLENYALSLDFRNLDHFRRVVLREWFFRNGDDSEKPKPETVLTP